MLGRRSFPLWFAAIGVVLALPALSEPAWSQQQAPSIRGAEAAEKLGCQETWLHAQPVRCHGGAQLPQDCGGPSQGKLLQGSARRGAIGSIQSVVCVRWRSDGSDLARHFGIQPRHRRGFEVEHGAGLASEHFGSGSALHVWQDQQLDRCSGTSGGVRRAADQEGTQPSTLDVRRGYFGLLLARNSLSLLSEAASKLDKAIEKLAKQVEDGEADEFDLFKLQTYRAEIDARTAEAHQYEAIAVASLAFLTNVKTGFEISSETLEPAKHPLGPVARYLQAARIHRPEINMVRAGIRAREAQVALARAKMYPDLGLGMSAGWTRAPEITDQLNPYVKDNANYFSLGFGW